MAKNIVVIRAPEGAHVVVVRGRAADDPEICQAVPAWQVRALLGVLEAQVLQPLMARFGGRPVCYDWATSEGAWGAVPYGTDAHLTVHVDGGEDIPVVIRRGSELTIHVERIVRSTWSARS